MITRKRQLLEANWDEYQAEEESRERIKRIQVYFSSLKVSFNWYKTYKEL